MNAPTVAPAAETASALPASLRMGAVRLRVRDGARSVAFYRDVVGLTPLGTGPDGAIRLGAGGRALVELEVAPGATPRPRGTTGLFHLAILVPDRAALAVVLRRLAASRVPIGASDHLVSEALYFDDPDGNGIEVYRDRPRGEWRWQGGSVAMATESLDLHRLVAEAPTPVPVAQPMPDATIMGHVHLQVGDLEAARRFYVRHLGFAITTESYPGALFVSAGGYHHHLGLNTWSSRRGGPPPVGAVGLVHYEVVLPEAEIAALRARLAAAGEAVHDSAGGFTVADPWSTRAVFVAG
ncbi:VOC family protein [Ancylobacter defluvii]|uniref:Catechol-2,3-dioxygenase n=1 Tax=Ancylobacter defluvii TaxID=1282440 RepID=A0A9W6JTP8_9HYPH|nr:VOC family protein [Ancylobacter defluvii]MBS7587433.1 VOC family protein [Ancylobacter defluvii]GLK82124.1 catechol-2,3-dioxygenase [Ancylobacter defluvii]